MAKKNNYHYERFVVENPPEELYGWKYGVDDSKTQYDTNKGQRAAALKSPAAVYMFALVAFMVFWFIYSFVHAVRTDGTIIVLAKFLPSLFVLFVCALIVFLTVFGAWGKFVRWALERNAVSNKDGARDRLQAEVKAADANKGREKALNIYEDYVEVINYGNRQVLQRSLLRSVIIRKYGRLCSVRFISLRGESVDAYADIPSADIHKIKEIFGGICEVENYAKRRERETIEKHSNDNFYFNKKLEFNSDKIGGLVMGFICAAVGGVVIALHYCLEPKIPMPLGIFFIVGGFIAILSVFDNLAVIKAFGIPFLFGVLLAGFPFMAVFSIAQSEGIPVVLPTFHEFLCNISPMFCGFFFLAGIGFMLIINAFVQLFKYIKNR